ncbi:hypothetical protein ACS0TY_011886 [Phlomoides rotata]
MVNHPRSQKEHAFMQNTRVHNKTEIQLTFIDNYYGSIEKWSCYGSEITGVPARGRMTFCFGKYVRKSRQCGCNQEIHVLKGEDSPEVLFKLKHSDFQDNKGNELIFDLVHGRLTYYFVPTTPARRIRLFFSRKIARE